MARLIKKVQQTQQPEFLPHVLAIAEFAAEHKAANLRAYDVRNLTVIADAFVICSATSEPHLRALFNAVKEGLKEMGVAPLRSEGTFHGGWLVMDYGTVIFHIFRVTAREFYDLDGLWGDAPEIDLGHEAEGTARR